jgi:Zn-dependent peptidase ImmA (M78 family)
VRDLLNSFDNDVDRTVDHYGLIVTDTHSEMGHTDAAIIGNVIFVRKNITPLYRNICVLHELAHHLIHAKCIGYRIEDKVLVSRDEREAETFAALVLFPSLKDYETEKQFKQESLLPPRTARARINYWKRTGI